MAAKKQKVEFVKRYEDRDKDGNKTVIEAGAVVYMTAAQIKAHSSKIRVTDAEPDDETEGAEGAGDEASGD